MFYHLGWPSFSLGWAGVPFFFVLSGFLITGILLDCKGASAGSFFGRFYIRRTLRIFPLYYLYLAVVFGWCTYHGVQGKGWWYYMTYLQNYYLGITDFAWTPGQEVGHTWSLAVEEQFYLLWPLLVFHLSPRRLKQVIAGMFAVAIASRFALHGNQLMVSFAPLTSNLDTLGMGALLAIISRENRAEYGNIARWLLLAGMAFAASVYLLTDHHLTTSDQIYMVAMTVLFGGVVGFVSSRTLPMLDWAPLAYIGRISYGLYIWHALAYGVVNSAIYNKWVPDPGAVWADTARIALTFGVAALSYSLFERPILRLKDKLIVLRPLALTAST
ncbi:acyltransferase family protein [Ralstonia mannitolilytica]|uniref:acyltransferase family protein n=1 Tax=Ralstonia mannitolilytica TaxID=105219 RepID=UPI0007B09D55|nr:acyltransferase [Ralstonia mannitolilytica]